MFILSLSPMIRRVCRTPCNAFTAITRAACTCDCDAWGSSGRRASTRFRSTTNTLGTRCFTWSEIRCGPDSWPRAASGDGQAPRCIWGSRKASCWIWCVGALASTQLVGTLPFRRRKAGPDRGSDSRSDTARPLRKRLLRAPAREKPQPGKTRQPNVRKLQAVNELVSPSQRRFGCQWSLTPFTCDPVYMSLPPMIRRVIARHATHSQRLRAWLAPAIATHGAPLASALSLRSARRQTLLGRAALRGAKSGAGRTRGHVRRVAMVKRPGAFGNGGKRAIEPRAMAVSL
jgi:hypothetical protein